MKRLFTAGIALFLCMLLLLGGCVAEGSNLLSNGGFEERTSDGGAAGWSYTAYRTQPGCTYYEITDERAHSGTYSAMIDNVSANDARYIATVQVEPESLYRISGYVWVDTMEDYGGGANFALEDIYAASEGLYQPTREWQYLEWYGETGENQTEMRLGVRVGGYSAESVGRAFFDDLSVEKVNATPDGVIASLLFENQYTFGFSQEDAAEETEENLNATAFVALAALFALAVFLGSVLIQRNRRKLSRGWTLFLLILTVLVALILRLVLALRVAGYPVDISCFQAWALRIVETGPAGFYADGYFCDYPPGMVLLLYPIGLLLRSAGNSTDAVRLIIKLLPCLFDFAGAALLYGEAARREKKPLGVGLAALYLLSPAVLTSGAAWGQADSVLGFFLLAAVILVSRGQWAGAFPVYFIAVLMKPQALLAGPPALVMWLLSLLRCKGQERKALLKQSLKGIGAGFACLLAIVVPFSLRQEHPIGWLFELYGETLSSYSYATLNTANLHYLFGGNWMDLAEKAPAALCLFLGLGSAVLTGLGALYLRKHPAPVKARCLLLSIGATATLFPLLVWLLGGSYSLLGYGLLALCFGGVVLCMLLSHSEARLSLWLALTFILIYVLSVKVHERYLFPALPLLLLAYLLLGDRRLLVLFVGFSCTMFVNSAIVLNNALTLGSAYGHLNLDTLEINSALCVCNLLLVLFTLWTALTPAPARKELPWETLSQEDSQKPEERRLGPVLHPRDERLRLGRKDALLMAIVTAAYALFTFTTLGSTTAPQTAWLSTAPQETVTLDLGEIRDFRLLYYAGVSYEDFTISISEDGETWESPVPCEMNEGLCYRWLYVVKSTGSAGEAKYLNRVAANNLLFHGRYVRVCAQSSGLNLWEVVARDTDGNNLPLTFVSHEGGNTRYAKADKGPEHLVDEMDTCVGEPGWYNGTYFDEIYYARTAYNHLHGENPYETTHPPLGKLLMAASVAIFGMTPFGWRFAGALIGVLMLPVMYLLAMQLFHKRRAAFLSMMALALDLMHLSQTRLATIDSFPVFFILLSWLWMIRFSQSDAFAVEGGKENRLTDKAFWRRMGMLFHCGVCMGLSIASKWIGMYSAVGLAVLFFATMLRHYRGGLAATDAPPVEDAAMQSRLNCAAGRTVKRIGLTCLLCVGFFGVIPCLIYALSFIPHLAPGGQVTLQRIIQAQINMFNYHSTPGLGMDHPFYSPWWQWPLMLKPMWFVQDGYEPAGYASTIVSMGNPWIFYMGALATAAMLLLLIFRLTRGIAVGRELTPDREDSRAVPWILALCFLVQYLPWVLVPRGTYIYHYFASVPFIIMITVWWMERLSGRYEKLARTLMAMYLVLAAVAFVVYLPYASGLQVSTGWLNGVRLWFNLYY